MNKVIYYAHSYHLYDTFQEKRDLQLIQQIFPNYTIINPSTSDFQESYIKNGGMEYCKDIIKDCCGLLIFRSLPDHKIGAGVYAEIKFAEENNIPVLELPTIFDCDVLSIEDTRKYISLSGKH